MTPGVYKRVTRPAIIQGNTVVGLPYAGHILVCKLTINPTNTDQW